MLLQKNEDIITKPIKPKFDGFTDALVPILNRLDRYKDVVPHIVPTYPALRHPIP
jgi:hypothetical protein